MNKVDFDKACKEVRELGNKASAYDELRVVGLLKGRGPGESNVSWNQSPFNEKRGSHGQKN